MACGPTCTATYFQRASNHNWPPSLAPRIALQHTFKEHQITTPKVGRALVLGLQHTFKEHQITTSYIELIDRLYCNILSKSIKSQRLCEKRLLQGTATYFQRASNHNLVACSAMKAGDCNILSKSIKSQPLKHCPQVVGYCNILSKSIKSQLSASATTPRAHCNILSKSIKSQLHRHPGRRRFHCNTISKSIKGIIPNFQVKCQGVSCTFRLTGGVEI